MGNMIGTGDQRVVCAVFHTIFGVAISQCCSLQVVVVLFFSCWHFLYIKI